MWTRFRVCGLNVDRQFDKMIKSGIVAKKVVRVDKKTIEFNLCHKQKSKGIAFFSDEWYNVLTINNAPLASFFSFVKNRFVFLACLTLIFVSLLLLDGYVWQVKIFAQGDENQIAKVLSDNGFGSGCKKDQINLDKIENLLCNNLPNANYAIVSLKGNVLFVEVFYKNIPQDIVDLSQPKNLYATQEGVISRVTVVNGTARVSVGDFVKKGQLLIEGVRTFSDGSVEQTCAVGEVFATVSSVGEHQFVSTKKVLQKTDEFKKVFGLSFLGFDTKPNLKVYDRQVEESFCKQLFPLPIKITTTIVYKAKEVDEQVPFDLTSCKQKALALALLNLQTWGEVAYDVLSNEGGMLVRATVFGQKQIGAY